jgi:transcription-repair coupling factor (superfamily II helicase)
VLLVGVCCREGFVTLPEVGCKPNKTTIEPIKIINLVQTQPKNYQIKGQNQLIFKQEMPEDIRRIELLEDLLKTLANTR